MKKIVFIFIVLIFLCSRYIHPQDSLQNSFNTKKFDITVNLSDKFLKDPNWIDSQLPTKVFSDCNKIILINDSCFNLIHKSGSNIMLYKNITKIGFYVQRRTLEGIWRGGLTGALGGIFLATVFKNSIKNNEGSGMITFLLYESILIFTGSAIGGTIGYFSLDTFDYDIQKYPPDYRKNVLMSLFLKYKVNL